MIKNLVIVESPAKARTIEKFLGKDYTVMSSMGHVVDLSKKDLSVDIENGFEPKYEISPDKKKVVTNLKKSARDAEWIWLATDEDREGEAISWHLVNALKIKEDKTKRIVFHEITKTAIDEAIKNPRQIDKNLVNAQQARRVLDRLVGYELSPLLWRKVKPGLSAGRVQSVAVRLIVEREEEIRNFKKTSSYRITAQLILKEGKGQKIVNAELPKRFKTKEEALEFLKSCQGAKFKVDKVEKKPAQKSPAPPFTTSTLQQEASRKLGFSVANTMRIAQNLYESGKITYMRTDSVNISKMAMAQASQEIKSLYGDEYVRTRQFRTRSKGAQEAHEAIRPTFMNKRQVEGNVQEKRLYELIWKRTLASQMAEAKIEKTNVDISISTSKEKLVAKGEIIKFDGFLKVYLEGRDDDEQEEKAGVLPPLKKGDELDLKEMLATERFTKHPPRYSEASLVKKMEELGIGRPSTYAPTISTIQKREYVVKEDRNGEFREYDYISLQGDKISEQKKKEMSGVEKGKLFPTDLGTLVNKFLMQFFNNIMKYNFTAKVEKEFDEIAAGDKKWNKMIGEFYSPFHDKIQETAEKTKKFSGERLLGKDPESGKNVFAKIGRYGPMVQIGDTESEEKPKFAGMRKGQSIETITLEEALKLFDFPRSIGEYEGKELTVNIGRFGPYVRHDNQFFSLKKEDDPAGIGQERAIELIEEKRKKASENTIREFDKDKKVKVLKGRYGPYIKIGRKNFKIPKDQDPEKLSLEDCYKIAEDPKNTPRKRYRKKK
ncbi:MAG: type I DNA topoisomerase [Bacteroidales bacterium]|nr:type I DNA topoisomerase [Bacteroidales bacterium]MCF8387046.1 type I DNA topoisomerase [Bacteroidales bacterium]MCF8397677.1 type I DNA topoisomerase [Bacteroidales bacterium]